MRFATGLALLLAAATAEPIPAAKRGYPTGGKCQKTKVAVLGAGTAGIFAARALHEAHVDDFMIIEYQDHIGGRVFHTDFGKDPKTGKPYTIELGANWVQGIGSKGGPENPIWTLAKKYKLVNTYSDYSSIETYTQDGPKDYKYLQDEFETAYAKFEQDAGHTLTDNLQDKTARTGFTVAGWKPRHDPLKQAVEWFNMDFEYAQSPEQCSHMFSVVNFNTTFYQFSDENNFVHDSRGFNAFIIGEANRFLKKNDPRLKLNTIVTGIDYSDTGVTVHNKDGSCVEADYAICTFSVGVLQHDVITFKPELPSWKVEGISAMTMATYTKIFFQFPPDQVFWDKNTQFFLYADPYERGYYPVWQSLDTPGFIEGSGILFVTVVMDESFRAEQLDNDVVKEEALEVLRKMFGKDKVPEPTAFFYPRWSQEEWAYGSYSNWGPDLTLERHENLRANLGRLWFAGEGTSAEYFGFLQGAYTEGKVTGEQIGGCIAGNKTDCKPRTNYPVLHGTTPPPEYVAANGWYVSTFLTYGFES